MVAQAIGHLVATLYITGRLVMDYLSSLQHDSREAKQDLRAPTPRTQATSIAARANGGLAQPRVASNSDARSSEPQILGCRSVSPGTAVLPTCASAGRSVRPAAPVALPRSACLSHGQGQVG